jgi:signal transduction histidine kinase
VVVLNDILDFSKIEAGKLQIEQIPFDPREMLKNALIPLQFRARLQDLTLTCDIDPQVPASLFGDPVRVSQVVTNLVSNAVKFTPQGSVTVSVKAVALDEAGAELLFSVTDTGIGIPADRLDSVFQAFLQADSSITRRFGGTGLGLAISRRLVELMGGKIWASSEEGKGSTLSFHLRFSIMRSEPQAGPSQLPASPSYAGPRSTCSSPRTTRSTNSSSRRFCRGASAGASLPCKTAAKRLRRCSPNVSTWL